MDTVGLWNSLGKVEVCQTESGRSQHRQVPGLLPHPRLIADSDPHHAQNISASTYLHLVANHKSPEQQGSGPVSLLK